MRRPIATIIALSCGLLAVFFLLWGIQLGMLYAPTAGARESDYLARAETYLVVSVAFLAVGIFCLFYMKR